MRNTRALQTRRGFLQGVASVTAASALPGCGYHSNYVYTPPSGDPLPLPDGPVVQGSLAVTATAIGAIPSRFMGLSYEKLAMNYGYFHASNHNLIALFRQLGAGVLRLGGGFADSLLWTPSANGTHQQISPTNVRNLAGFLQATGWLCLYTVNLATSTPALAAEEVAFAVPVLGESLLGIEIGNESDEYGVKGNYFPGNWTFQDFIDRWDAFHSAILQVAPHVPITGPAAAGGNHISTWTLPFGQIVTSSGLTLLTQHYYRQSGASPTSTAAFLVSPDEQLTTDLGILQAGAQQLGIPYRMSECNSFYNGGAAGVSNSYASSLWVLDFLFNVAMAGATGVNMHGGGNAPGYTPIADDSGAVIEARPEYYGLLLFALAGTGTLLGTQLSAGSVDVTAYAVRTPSGGLNIILVNKDTLQNLTLTIQANQVIHTASMQIMTGPSLAAISGVTIQGATMNKDGTFAPVSPGTLTPAGGQTTCFLPALSAALISIS
jgi:hypothetical protein